MKKILIGFILLLASFAAGAEEYTVNADGSATITLTVQEVVSCMNLGGCALLPIAILQGIVSEQVRHACGKEI